LGPDALKQVQQAENLEEARKVLLPKNPICRVIWSTLEYPEYSLAAKIVNIVSLFFILLSAVGLAVETLPTYHRATNDQCQHEADGRKMIYFSSITRRLFLYRFIN
jgi:glucose uptake protein GlcU